MLAVTAVIVSYPYWWSQAAALADQITNTILSVPAVSRGLHKLMEYAVDGVALGGWQLIDLGLMGAIGLELIGLIFLKVVVILLGALLYATGPGDDRPGPDPRRQRARPRLGQRRGRAAAARSRVGDAVRGRRALIGDSGTAGPLIAGNSATSGVSTGGLLLAVAGLDEPVAVPEGRARGRSLCGCSSQACSSWAASEHHRPRRRPRAPGGRAANRCASTDRALPGRRAPPAASSHSPGAGGGAVARAGRAAGYVGRRGLIGTAAARRSARDRGRRVARRSGLCSLPPRCRGSPDGARRYRQLANQAQPWSETTRSAHGGRGRTGRQRDPPKPFPRTPGTAPETTGAGAVPLPPSSANTRLKLRRADSRSNGNGSPGSRPAASADRSARSTGRWPSSSARPASPLPAEQRGSSRQRHGARSEAGAQTVRRAAPPAVPDPQAAEGRGPMTPTLRRLTTASATGD